MLYREKEKVKERLCPTGLTGKEVEEYGLIVTFPC
jgi:hypothetical protein